MKNVTLILLGATLLTTVACGNKDSKKRRPQPKSNPLLTEGGKYQATLSPINAHLAGDVMGTATVRVNGDTMTVEMKVNGSPAQIVHAQNIHLANNCPTLVSDTNNDGVIDGVEGLKNYGPAVIPLDFNLKTQIENDEKFPAADFTGNYYYNQTVSMMEMMNDLTAADKDLKDNVVKISSSLGLAGRQVVIFGVAADANLPDSVAAVHGQSKHSSLPIACGSLVKVADDIEGTHTTGGKDE